LTAHHKQETEKAAVVIEAQRQEIEQLKAQRLADIENRSQEKLAEQAKAKEQEDATNLLRYESATTKLEVRELQKDMQQMMQQMMTAFSTASKSQENKRSNDHNNPQYNSPSEKRRDVRSTPGKKLFFDEQDLRDSKAYLDAMVADNTHNSPNHD
jgi:hypothetical protein